MTMIGLVDEYLDVAAGRSVPSSEVVCDFAFQSVFVVVNFEYLK